MVWIDDTIILFFRFLGHFHIVLYFPLVKYKSSLCFLSSPELVISFNFQWWSFWEKRHGISVEIFPVIILLISLSIFLILVSFENFVQCLLIISTPFPDPSKVNYPSLPSKHDDFPFALKHNVQLVLLICTWMYGFLLEKKKMSLAIAAYLGQGFHADIPSPW